MHERGDSTTRATLSAIAARGAAVPDHCSRGAGRRLAPRAGRRSAPRARRRPARVATSYLLV